MKNGSCLLSGHSGDVGHDHLVDEGPEAQPEVRSDVLEIVKVFGLWDRLVCDNFWRFASLFGGKNCNIFKTAML
jgi:hypothetical protein